MTMKTTSINDLQHEELRLDLPWLANGTLDEDQARQLRRHVDQCDQCHQELAELTAMQEAVRRAPVGTIDTQASLRAMQQRIDLERSNGITHKIKRFIDSLSGPQWAVAGLSSLAVVLVLMQMNGSAPSGVDAPYSVLSSGDSVDSITIYAVLREPMAAGEADALLTRLTESAGFSGDWVRSAGEKYQLTVDISEQKLLAAPEGLSTLLDALQATSAIVEAGVREDD